MNRTQIINTIIKKIKAKKYLEIGINDGANFNNIHCEYKSGVDPNKNSPCNFHMTSDIFFEQNSETFDLIFIDGLHHSEQVEKDINNAIKILNTNGYIVCHDMNPSNELMQKVPCVNQGTEWTGDCWKAWVNIKSSNPNLYMRVVNTDYGCGIITRGQQKLITLDYELTYENLDKNRNYWLNLITVEDFIKELEENP
jgi:SAM-dependent methyltransferase